MENAKQKNTPKTVQTIMESECAPPLYFRNKLTENKTTKASNVTPKKIPINTMKKT